MHADSERAQNARMQCKPISKGALLIRLWPYGSYAARQLGVQQSMAVCSQLSSAPPWSPWKPAWTLFSFKPQDSLIMQGRCSMRQAVMCMRCCCARSSVATC